MMRLTLPALLLAFCGMAAAQAVPASTQPPAAPQQAAAAPLSQVDSGKAAALPVSAAPLPPQQQRLLDQADQLLVLAQQLKAEVDKTDQYTLSLNTLRRADDIEKLAKNLQKQLQHEDR